MAHLQWARGLDLGQVTRIPAATRSLGMDGKLLDDRVRQQFRGKLGDPLRRCGLGQVDLEPLALADPGHLAEAESPARAGNCLTLRIVDLRLQHDIDDEPWHNPNSTRTRVPGAP